jgi:arsenite methyltransferase
MNTFVPKNASYGIDAPFVVLSFIIAGIACIAISLFLNQFIADQPVFALLADISGIVLGFLLLLGAASMIWSSKKGKFLLREQLIDSLALKGNETVLDIGCGRGLLLNSAARRLITGKAIGIDIWQTQDQSGNSPEVTLLNAKAEGVMEHVEIKTGDMRKLPFPDESIDVIISSIAIHNIHEKEGQAKTIEEIARVLKSGGKIGIVDFRTVIRYAEKILAEMGWKNLTVSRRDFRIMPPVRILQGRKN